MKCNNAPAKCFKSYLHESFTFDDFDLAICSILYTLEIGKKKFFKAKNKEILAS